MATRSLPRRAATPPIAPGPLVRDFSGTRTATSVRVDFDVRTVFDFVFSLSAEAASTDDIPAPDRHWAEGSRTEMRALFGESLDRYGDELCVMLAGLVVDRPEVRTASDFVDLVSRLDDATLVRAVMAEDLREPMRADQVERALAGDDEAIAAVVRRASDCEGCEDRERTATALFRRPESVFGPARGILAAWLDRYAPLEERILSMLQHDVELRAADRRSLEVGELIEKTTGGVRYRSEPAVARVILAPSYFARPYNFLLGGVDWRLFGYPISDAALDGRDPLAPPQSVVRFHRSLGDDTRLRILRLLRDRDLYLTEIAQLLELSKPTIKHHLAQLRVAGLVTVTDEGGLTYYSLRRERLAQAADELRQFLLD
jgi:DNA-binding transcriptional ArsR family regulator